jgi:hypothetical protein
MLLKLNQRAQTTAEYAILIAIVIGAVVAMQVYMRRGMQGRIRNVVDHVGAGGKVGDTDFAFKAEQYEPYYISSDASSARQSTEQEVLGGKGEVGRGTSEQTMQYRNQVTGWTADDKATAATKADATAPNRPTTPAVAAPEAAK